MFGLVVRFDLRLRVGAAFDALVDAVLSHIRARKPGTLLYLCHAVDGAPNARLLRAISRSSRHVKQISRVRPGRYL